MSDKEISKIDTSDKQSLKGIETARSNVTANAIGVSSAKKRASYPYDSRGGIVQDRPYPPPSERLRSAATPAATPHPVKFSGPGDAVNAHADADHGAILVVAQVRVIFWGTEWASASPPVSMATVMGDVKSILGGPYLDGLAQYDVDRAFVSQVHELTDEDPPNPFGRGDASDRVNRLIDDGVFPEPDADDPPAVYAVFLPSLIAGTD